MDMEKYGVFISHSHADWALAGRVFDYLDTRGFRPFLDADSLQQGNYHEALEACISQTPYFLCILTEHISFQTMEKNNWIYNEILLALQHNRDILLLAEKGFSFPEKDEDMPLEILPLKKCHMYEFDRTSFLDTMIRMCKKDLKVEKLAEILDWRKVFSSRGNVFLCGRKQIERDIASLEVRFGQDFVRCVREGRKYTGKNHIKSIHMSCYAASIIFSHELDMIDEQAFDRGLMFNIFAQLLEDEDFFLEIVINAPGSFAVQEAISNNKLGNSALEDHPEAIFLSSYCNIHRLITEDPVFKKAYQNKRFRFMVTENSLMYALFQVTYKKGYEEYDHIKIDLYSEGLVSSMERRCMIIFRENDPDNFSFFVERYNHIRNAKESRRLMKGHHLEWVEEWAKLQEEMAI